MMRPMDADDDAARVEFLANRPESSLYNKREKAEEQDAREEKKTAERSTTDLLSLLFLCLSRLRKRAQVVACMCVCMCKAVRVLRTLFA